MEVVFFLGSSDGFFNLGTSRANTRFNSLDNFYNFTVHL